MKYVYILLVIICLLLAYIIYLQLKIIEQTKYSYIENSEHTMWRVTNNMKAACLIPITPLDLPGMAVNKLGDCIDLEEFITPSPTQ